ncbi:MAG: AI-2E family transporter [Pseudomonadota bacterium]|nr:AI-2E family transporter [Pseudomonadota bacterium]
MTPEYQSRMRDTVLIIAGFLIILAWVRYAQGLIVPFLLALFFAIIAATPVNWLKSKGLPISLAVMLVIVVGITLGVFLTLILSASVDQFSQSLPEYQTRLRSLASGLLNWLATHGMDVPESVGMLNVIDPGQAMGYANSLMSSLGGVFGNAFLILFTVLFMLLESGSFPQKVIAIYGSRSGMVLDRYNEVIKSTRQYLSVKAVLSLVTGFLVGVGTALIGLDFAILWGFLAFALNFIPNIGSIIAAVPAVLLSLVQLGTTETMGVILVYLTANIVIGNIVEPRYMGEKVGLSTLVVFLSLVFWGWLLGLVGMLLSVPLTMTVKFTSQASDETRWLGILLGPGSESKEE